MMNARTVVFGVFGIIIGIGSAALIPYAEHHGWSGWSVLLLLAVLGFAAGWVGNYCVHAHHRFRDPNQGTREPVLDLARAWVGGPTPTEQLLAGIPAVILVVLVVFLLHAHRGPALVALVLVPAMLAAAGLHVATMRLLVRRRKRRGGVPW